MKALVAIKRVLDPNIKAKVNIDCSGVDLSNVKMALNPFCEIAVEEAVRLKEKGVATEIVAVSVGPSAAQEQLRTALALGADRAIQHLAGMTPRSSLQSTRTKRRRFSRSPTTAWSATYLKRFLQSRALSEVNQFT